MPSKGQVGLADALGAVRLQDVAFLEVVEAVKGETTFKAYVDFAHVVPEVLEAGDGSGE